MFETYHNTRAVSCKCCQGSFVPEVTLEKFNQDGYADYYVGDITGDDMYTGIEEVEVICPNCNGNNVFHLMFYRDIFLGFETNYQYARGKVDTQKFHLYGLAKRLSEEHMLMRKEFKLTLGKIKNLSAMSEYPESHVRKEMLMNTFGVDNAYDALSKIIDQIEFEL